jgi:hypothetical protein
LQALALLAEEIERSHKEIPDGIRKRPEAFHGTCGDIGTIKAVIGVLRSLVAALYRPYRPEALEF